MARRWNRNLYDDDKLENFIYKLKPLPHVPEKATWHIDLDDLPKDHYHLQYRKGTWYFLNRDLILAKATVKGFFDFKYFVSWCRELEIVLRTKSRKKHNTMRYNLKHYDRLIGCFAAKRYSDLKALLEENNDDPNYDPFSELLTFSKLMHSLDSGEADPDPEDDKWADGFR